LFRMICSLVRPCVGEIVVDGHRLWSDGLRSSVCG
jgi:hypothetical protein